jgi:hypothetical protein
MTPSNPRRAFVIDRAATVAAIERYELSLARALRAVEAFSDLPEGEALRIAGEAHDAAEAEMKAADAALLGEIRRWRPLRLFPAVAHRGIIYAPTITTSAQETGAKGPKQKILRISVADDIIELV